MTAANAEPTLSGLLRATADALEARARFTDRISPTEMLEMARCLARWAKAAQILEAPNQLAAAKQAQAELERLGLVADATRMGGNEQETGL